MSRDFIEAGLGWKYDAPRVLRAIRDRETLVVVACESAKSAGDSRGAIAGFAVIEFGDERAHLVLLAVRPSHRRLGIGQRLLDEQQVEVVQLFQVLGVGQAIDRVAVHLQQDVGKRLADGAIHFLAERRADCGVL